MLLGKRRQFLEKSGLAAIGVVATASLPGGMPNVLAAEKYRWGMAIDLQRCVLCRACTVACKQENKTPPEMFYNPVMEEENGAYPDVHRRWFPRPCMHCENPACLTACPANAIKKRSDGIVFIDPDICEGYQECITACPYEVPKFDNGKNYHGGKSIWSQIPSPELNRMLPPQNRPFRMKARKCTFCLHKQDEKGAYVDLPACAKTCMGKAIRFGDFADPNSEVSQLIRDRIWLRLKEDAGTDPSVYYLL